MTAHRNALPSGWTSATVGDLGDFMNGLAFKPSDWEDSGRPIIRIQNLTGKNEAFNLTTRVVSDDFIVSAGDILVSWSATLDVFVWRGPEAVLNQHIFKVVPARGMTDHVFVRWALKNAIGEMWVSEHTHGTTMRHINRGPFLAHSVPLPPSREQARIADALESHLSRLDAAVGTLETAQKKLKAYRGSVLKAAIEGRLVPNESALARAEKRDCEPAEVLLKRILTERRQRWEEAELAKLKAVGKSPKDDKWRAKYEEPQAPDAADLPKLPEGWCWSTIDALIADGPQNGLYVPQARYGTGIPILRIDDFQPDWSRAATELQQVDVEQTEAEKFALRAGDLVVNRVNSMTHLGKTLAVEERHVPALFESNMMRFSVSRGVEPRYLWAYLCSGDGKRRLTQNAKWAVNQASINQKDVGACCIPLPPHAEQLRILAEIDRLQTASEMCATAARQNAQRCGRLRQAVLKWAFEGKLVDQDPADERAEKLLERIRADRASTETQKRSRRARNSQ